MQDFKVYLENLDGWAAIDVLAVIALVFGVILFFKRRRNLMLAIIVTFFSLVYLAVSIVNVLTDSKILFLTRWVLNVVGLLLMFSIVVAYQNNIKTFFAKLSRVTDKNKSMHLGTTEDDLRGAAAEIAKGCQTLSKNDTGALLVIVPTTISPQILETGTMLHANISCGLLESIFNTKTPLHDGAVIIKENVLMAAGCFLPVSQDHSLSKELGSRHRAAIGITEETDVLAIIVSEETGIISTAKNGQIKRYITPDKLLEQIEETFGLVAANKQAVKKRIKNID